MTLQNEICSITKKPFPLRMILRVVGLSSAAWYGVSPLGPKQRPGPKPKIDDTKALELIKKKVSGNRFVGEGYIKTALRLRRDGHSIAKHRVHRLMQENQLLSPTRPVSNGRKREHKGRIITAEPNKMWATDGKKFYAGKNGWCWFFGVIDHFNDEIIAFHVAKRGTRFAAMEPVRRAVRKCFGSVEKDICSGMELRLRSDHGSQYDSTDFMAEMNFLGLDMSKAYVRSPQCNGIIERFHRTLEEQVFAIYNFESLDHAKEVLDQFVQDYNKQWILHRTKGLSPIEYREAFEVNKRG